MGLEVVTADVSDMHVVGPPPVMITDGVLPFEDGTFSAALLFFMLAYPDEPAAVLERIDRLLRGESPAVEAVPDPASASDPESADSGSAERSDVSAVVSSVPEGASAMRRLELVAGKSSKFWEVAQIGCTLKIRYGRTGTKGQTLTKEFDTEAKTLSEMEKLAGEKLRKGYVETQRVEPPIG